jgi:hypothetical protein
LVAILASLFYNILGAGIMVRAKTVAKKKSTYFISEDLLSEIKEMVPFTGLRSQNALVEEALRSYVNGFKRENIRKQYLEASQDPMFLADIREIESDFEIADAESAKMIQ